jgi:hypothetical protein
MSEGRPLLSDSFMPERPPDSWPGPDKGNVTVYAVPTTSTKPSEFFSGEPIPQTNGSLKVQSYRANGFFSATGVNSSEVVKNSHAHGPDIEVLMPKLHHSDYFTEPRIQELAAKERAEPGYCRRVVDFVVGRLVCIFPLSKLLFHFGFGTFSSTAILD